LSQQPQSKTKKILKEKLNYYQIEAVSKDHYLPLTLRSGYSSSSEEEKVIILNINTFPSFLKGAERKEIALWAILAKEPDCRGGHARKDMTGLLKTLLEQPHIYK